MKAIHRETTIVSLLTAGQAGWFRLFGWFVFIQQDSKASVACGGINQPQRSNNTL